MLESMSSFTVPPRGFEYYPLHGDTGRKNKKHARKHVFFYSAPTGIRTPVVALKGPRPSPLDDGGIVC